MVTPALSTPPTPPTPVGIVLFAHGSRDPLWRQPMDAVAERIRTLAPGTLVVCAFLELTSPDLLTAATSLVAQGVQHISVVPLFLGVGKHARADLPVLVAQVRDQHPGISLRLQAAVGEDPRLIDLLARIALD
jgi:sirohydrochlorin cobaltochelatase